MMSLPEILKNETECSIQYRYMIISYELYDMLMAIRYNVKSEIKIALSDLITMVRALSLQLGISESIFDEPVSAPDIDELVVNVLYLARLLHKYVRYGQKKIDEIEDVLKKIMAGIRLLCGKFGYDYNELKKFGEERLKEKIETYKGVWRVA